MHKYRNYTDMSTLLNPIVIGEAKVSILDYTNKELGFYETLSGLCHKKYAALYVNGSLFMSETPMEHRTNIDFVCNAHGDILIGGLGIGMIVLPIQDDDSVQSITIIEKSQDVIDAVVHQLPFNDKVKVICADVFDWKPDIKYDCIYMDIWSYINSDVYKEMKTLKRKYGHYLKSKKESPERFNRCWCEYEAKNNRKLI